MKPGDLILLQPDTIEQTMPWLMERYGDRLRGIGFDKIAEGQSSDSDEVPLDPRHNSDDAPEV